MIILMMKLKFYKLVIINYKSNTHCTDCYLHKLMNHDETCGKNSLALVCDRQIVNL